MRFFYILLKFHIFRGYIVYLGVFGLNIFYLISLRDSISSLEWSTMVDSGRQWSTMVDYGRQWSTVVDNGRQTILEDMIRIYIKLCLNFLSQFIIYINFIYNFYQFLYQFKEKILYHFIILIININTFSLIFFFLFFSFFLIFCVPGGPRHICK